DRNLCLPRPHRADRLLRWRRWLTRRVETILAGNMGIYQATIRWRRSTEETFTDGRYSRAHEWLFDGSASERASASPFTAPRPCSDPSGVDPEEALVAALSSCHMLFFYRSLRKKGSWSPHTMTAPSASSTRRRKERNGWRRSRCVLA